MNNSNEKSVLRRMMLKDIVLKITAIFLFAILFIGASCSSSVKPPCVSENNSEMKLRWGTHIISTGVINGYELDSKPGLYQMNLNNGDTAMKYINLGNVDSDLYCRYIVFILKKLTGNFPVYQPADTMNYIEFANPKADIFYRAAWNPKYITPANKDYRNLFDSLEALVPEKKM